MRAVRLSAPHQMTLVDLPIPNPAPDEALIRVAATGICGTDVELAHGTAPYFLSGRARYPLTPGHEWAGTITALGANVTGFRTGQQVVGECSIGCGICALCLAGAYHLCPDLTETGILNRPGGFAEYLTLPARALHVVPGHVPAATAALTEPCAVALNGVRRTGLGPGEALTILGDGPIGLLALLVARALGAGQITLVGATPHRLALAKRLGAHTLDVNTDPALPRTRRMLEATGNPDAVQSALTHMAPGGTLALLGLFGGGTLAQMNLDLLVINDITLTGVLGSPGLWPETIALIATGRLDPGQIISHRLALSDFPRAIALAETRNATKTILLQP